MKRIVLAGGGTGGHVYPLLAVADAINAMKIPDISLVYLGPTGGFDEEFQIRGIKISRLVSSKLRRYFDVQNFIDVPKFAFSLLQALVKLYFLMPDAVFSKGGPGALAAVIAARFYMIPVIIHESDSVPGLTNRISGHFAKRIAISFENALRYFSKKKTAFTGNPVRRELLDGWKPSPEAKRDLKYDPKLPLVLVLGGSQGAQRINSFIFDNLSVLLPEMQIFHQVGQRNKETAKETLKALANELPGEFRARYRMTDFLKTSELRLAMSAADVILSRAGSGAIYEIAAFGKPSVLIPLKDSAGGHQKTNAYEYSRTGACVVVEETNFTVHLILRELKRIFTEVGVAEKMAEAAKEFFKPNAAKLIATEVLRLAKAA